MEPTHCQSEPCGPIFLSNALKPCWKWLEILLTPSFGRAHICHLGFPGGASIKEPSYQCRRFKRCGSNPWVGKIPWRRKWHPTPVFLPKESHGQRSLAGMVYGITKSWTWLEWICTYTGTYAKGTINSTCLPSTRATDMPVSSNGTSSVHLFLGTRPQAPFSLPGNEFFQIGQLLLSSLKLLIHLPFMPVTVIKKNSKSCNNQWLLQW